MNLKSSFFEKTSRSIRIFHDEEFAAQQLSKQLGLLLPTDPARPVVIVCIGTDRSTGDSLGPLVGTKLKEKSLSHFHIYGTLKDPIHAVNLKDTLKIIQKEFDNPFIIGIDACLGRMKSVGSVSLGIGPVKPGAGVNKELPPVGDIHMTGIVNVSGFMEFFVLQNTRLYLVMSIAELIATSIQYAYQTSRGPSVSLSSHSYRLEYEK
ncbi:spore protease YyaC [Priestia flexa]|jgi:putative sporulation protein YyaC|uniref:Spore protease YyaC n=1 Tax=Priestia flexa TaxID=86664 RepID=A0A8I1MJH7_9BACI|nr:spore protease YyaC [Priestia flexa]MBN8253465.1 spore protease YyaC [Priestia flexa]MBN8433440.1 spore protease YyaC [Priestia flexa]MCA0966303.1 spore protease YyaC [Priestia flexa]RIV12839.1 spore protease YyaC [Priestia flexa]UIR30022.1 spore protease YyaC [Priestia flexa]